MENGNKVVVVYKCLICGSAWNNKQSLRAHMKAHKEKTVTTWIRVKPNTLEEFKDVCKKHNTTTCHLMGAIMEAVIVGDKTGAGINIGSPNPFTINVFHQFYGKPRSKFKIDLGFTKYDDFTNFMLGKHHESKNSETGEAWYLRKHQELHPDKIVKYKEDAKND